MLLVFAYDLHGSRYFVVGLLWNSCLKKFIGRERVVWGQTFERFHQLHLFGNAGEIFCRQFAATISTFFPAKSIKDRKTHFIEEYANHKWNGFVDVTFVVLAASIITWIKDRRCAIISGWTNIFDW